MSDRGRGCASRRLRRFADPKQSRIDIVQAAGRALRRYPGKEYGYILLPLVVPSKMKFEAFAKTTAFWQVASTITALSTQDERIAEEFRALENGRIPSGKIVEIEGDVPVGMNIKLGDFAEAISTRIWQSVGRANWRKFENARSFVQSIGLNSKTEWEEYRTSGRKPSDIPSAPDQVYGNAGWSSWGDWLGTERRIGGWRRFNDARIFVRSLKLHSATEWYEYCNSGKKPVDIPSVPNEAYEKAGWDGYNDWLGTRKVRGIDWMPFKKARAFVGKLHLKSVDEWRKYCKSGDKPAKIPATPDYAYQKSGWRGFDDWLGTGRRPAGPWRPFERARAFAHRLKVKSEHDWRKYCKSGKKPDDIPSQPDSRYAKDGWSSWGDWLGTGYIRGVDWMPFKEARLFARRLKLKSEHEWREYRSSGKKPDNIPSHPDKTYANAGWSSWGDWLGTRRRIGGWRSFSDARTFARSLRLHSVAQWREYCNSGKKPVDIPSDPSHVYTNAGWSGFGDWLGTGRVATFRRKYLPLTKLAHMHGKHIVVPPTTRQRVSG